MIIKKTYICFANIISLPKAEVIFLSCPGYAGNVLRVDLSKKEVKSLPLDKELIRDFIGGRGFVAKVLWDEVTPDVSPFSPDNPLVFATGPLTDLAPSAGRVTVGARSPTTEIHGDSNFGGLFGVELKRAGYDMMVIKGRSEKPVYLKIDENGVEIRDASHLWGKGVYETIKTLIKEVGDLDAHVACIGPAGENLVYTAAIQSDYNRSASKAGMGAVMGSKNLKAIVVRGTKETKVHDIKKFREAFEEALRIYEREPTTQLGRTVGSHFLHSVHNERGALLLKNGRYGYLPPEIFSKVDEKAVNRYHIKSTSGCAFCYISCERNFLVKSAKYGEFMVHGVDYYGLAPQSYRLDIFDLEEALYNCRLCVDLGLDLSSSGQIIALMMELYERGIVRKEDLDGMELKWGDSEAVRTILEKMAYREGVGKIFANGILGIIRRFPEAEKYAFHVKGLDNIPQDFRAARTYNLRYAISTRGADHMRASGLSKLGGAIAVDDMAVSEAIKTFLIVENFTTLVNLLEVCTWAWSAYTSSFEAYKAKEKVLVDLYNAVTGRNVTIDDLYKACHRTLILERAENNRYGLRRKDDNMPRRFLEEPLPTRPGQAHPPVTDFDERLTWYYRYRGIDEETGVPKKETLLELGLDYVAEDLERRGILGR